MDLIAVLRQRIWHCTGCGKVTENPHVRWNYEGIWCEMCYRPPAADQAHEWYTLSDVIRLLEG
jgi:hypothetical protein